MEDEIKYDNRLWFEHNGCEGKHYLIGNPHTFPGRMWAWCPFKKTTFFISKSEFDDKSSETEYWIKGFLGGNQPQPPSNENGDVDFESKEYKDWCGQIEDFENTGLSK